MLSPRQLASSLRRRLPAAARLARWASPRFLLRRWRLRGMSTEEVFTYIHDQRIWDSRESVSGAGSSLAATESIRRELTDLVSSLGVRTLLDAPCGDFYWMSRAELDLDLYIGGEIVKDLVDRLNDEYGGAKRRFVHLDITRDPLPAADAFLCRDCFLHLSHRDVQKALDNAVRSSATYLLASTYPRCEVNADIRTGLARPLNLCATPFDLPEPLRVLADPGVHGDEKCLGVWDLRQLRSGPEAP